MRWNVSLVFDEAALPMLEHGGSFCGSTVDCSDDDFGQLAESACDAAMALLKDYVEEEDMEIDLVAAERYPDLAWIGAPTTRKDEWRRMLDTKLPMVAGASVSTIWLRVAGNQDACDTLERQWTGAAKTALDKHGDVDSAYRVLNAVRSLRRHLLPGARCFNDFNNQPGVLDLQALRHTGWTSWPKEATPGKPRRRRGRDPRGWMNRRRTCAWNGSSLRQASLGTGDERGKEVTDALKPFAANQRVRRPPGNSSSLDARTAVVRAKPGFAL
jgi:hypothetical protein